MTTQEHLRLEHTARGFGFLPSIECTDGGTARVYESSATGGAYLWLATDSTDSEGHTTQVRLHMRLEDGLRLSEQLRFIAGHHYRRPRPRMSAADRIVTAMLRHPILSDAVGMLLCLAIGGLVLNYGMDHHEHQISLLGAVLCLGSLMFAVPLGVQLGGIVRRRRARTATGGPKYDSRWSRVSSWLAEDLDTAQKTGQEASQGTGEAEEGLAEGGGKS